MTLKTNSFSHLVNKSLLLMLKTIPIAFQNKEIHVSKNPVYLPVVLSACPLGRDDSKIRVGRFGLCGWIWMVFDADYFYDATKTWTCPLVVGENDLWAF